LTLANSALKSLVLASLSFTKKEEIVAQLITAVTNFPPRQVADFMSEVLVLGVVLDDGEVVPIQPDREVQLGKRIL
jgi:tRNA-binding protein